MNKKNDNKKDDEKGLKIFMVGFLVMGAGFLLGYFNFDSIATIIMWLGFFIGAAGMFINMSIVMEKRKK